MVMAGRACLALVFGLLSAQGAHAQRNTAGAQALARAGFPDWSRRWSSEELAEAAQAVTALARRDVDLLPVRGSAASGALFARMTSPENLATSCDDLTLPIAARMETCLAMCGSANVILKTYVHPNGQPGEPTTAAALGRHARKRAGELVDLAGLGLHCAAAQARTAQAFARTLDPTGPRYRVRMEGLTQLKQGLETTVIGVLSMLKEPSGYRRDEPERLIAFLNETLPEIVRHLLPKSRQTLLGLIEDMSADPAKGRIRPLLARLHDRLETSVKETLGTDPAPLSPPLARAEEKMTMHRVAAVGVQQGGWSRAVSTQGGFSVELPSAFNDYTVHENRAEGTLVPIHAVGTQTAAGARFLAVMLDRGGASGPLPPLKSMANFVPSIPGARMQQRMVEMGKMKANEVIAIGASQGVIARWFVARGDVYQLLVEYPILLRGVIDQDVRRFFGSFRLPSATTLDE